MSQETKKKLQLDPPSVPKWRILPFFQYFSLDVFSPELRRSPFNFWYLQYLKAAPDSAAEFLVERWLDLLYQIALMEYLLKKARKGNNLILRWRGPVPVTAYDEYLAVYKGHISSCVFVQEFKMFLGHFQGNLYSRKHYHFDGTFK